MENIDNEIDLVIKQLSFNTHIGLDGLFPRQVIGSDTCLANNLDVGERLLYKLVAGRHPAQCDGWEETVLSAGLEVFGTGVSEVDVQQVSILVAISKPAGYSLIAQGNGR